MMKRTAIALMAASLLGTMPAVAHSWYTGQRNPVTGASCCGYEDCVPLPPENLKFRDGHYVFKYPLDGKWYSIPIEQSLPSRDSRNHACVWGGNNESGPRLCIFIGGAT